MRQSIRRVSRVGPSAAPLWAGAGPGGPVGVSVGELRRAVAEWRAGKEHLKEGLEVRILVASVKLWMASTSSPFHNTMSDSYIL